jgi:hypothetical protein
MNTQTKPKIQINRIADLMENKQDIESFSDNKPPFVLTKSNSDNSLICITDNKQSSKDKDSYKEILLRLDKEVLKDIEDKTSGSKNAVINKLLKYAIDELVNKNITLK